MSSVFLFFSVKRGKSACGGRTVVRLFGADARIDPGIGKIRQKIDENKQKGSENHERFQCLQIGTVQGVDSAEPESGNPEEAFQKQTAGE